MTFISTAKMSLVEEAQLAEEMVGEKKEVWV